MNKTNSLVHTFTKENNKSLWHTLIFANVFTSVYKINYDLFVIQSKAFPSPTAYFLLLLIVRLMREVIAVYIPRCC